MSNEEMINRLVFAFRNSGTSKEMSISLANSLVEIAEMTDTLGELEEQIKRFNTKSFPKNNVFIGGWLIN